MTEFRNAEHALIALSAAVMQSGAEVRVRDSVTRERVHQAVTLREPLERVVAVPGRHNNVFAAIAETMWVVAGRDDIDFLLPYVPRASDYSDDGITWRGAYGPRLRNWHGLDQVALVADLLRQDPTTRRGVIMIYDPVTDSTPGLDIPCSNWIHFVIREGRLHMEVAVRSNDLFWGFSGINTFEWSVLQEIVAHWTGTEVGVCSYYISSLHIYERHFDRALVVASSLPRQRNHAGTRFATTPGSLAEELEAWFSFEAKLREGDLAADLGTVHDPLFRDFGEMLRVYWTLRSDRSGEAVNLLDVVASPDLVAGALDYVSWRNGVPAAQGEIEQPDVELLLQRLHRSKDAAYGDSWKRRGEQMGVMANLARKIDRLQRDHDTPLDGETRFDTAVDLAVYSIKYVTFILDELGTVREQGTWSDGPDGFDDVLIEIEREHPDTDHLSVFSDIESSILRGEPIGERLGLARQLATAAVGLVHQIAEDRPWLALD